MNCENHELKAFVLDDLEKVNHMLLSSAASNVAELIPTITAHLMTAGGKRIRATLTLAAAKILGYRGEADIILASAVEFIHTATLFHDDVIDEGVYRRGIPTAHRIWGNKASILVGDYLFAQAFGLMVQASSIDAIAVLSKASALVAEAEAWQLLNIANMSLTKAQYSNLIERKTASLFSAACEVGAIIAAASVPEIKAFSNFGLHLGIVFQIVDDVLDYTAFSQEYGKEIGVDFKEQKVTLPFIIALEYATAPDREQLKELMCKRNQEPSGFIDSVKLLKHYNAFERSIAIAEQHVELGLQALEPLVKYEKIAFLQHLIANSIKRND